jgi:hypothetical protein
MAIKRKFIALIIFFIFFAALAAGLFYYQASVGVSVKASMFDVSAQLVDGSNWTKWNPELKNATIGQAKAGNNNNQQVITTPNGRLLKLSIVSPASIIAEQSTNGSTVLQAIDIHSGKVYGYTDVQWIKKQNGFNWILDIMFRQNTLAKQLAGFKSYVENPLHVYGFPIRLTRVIDAVICTKKQYILPGNTLPYVEDMVSNIHSYLNSKNIKVKASYYYVSYSALINGKIELAVGVPVEAGAYGDKGYEFLELPENGQILTGTYNGPYSQLKNLYLAMDKYVMDKKLNKVAQPMEKYTTPATSIKPNTLINMQVIYPVY